MSLPRKSGVFYGYWVVAATFWCVFVFSGAGFYAFSLFVKPLQADLGWSRGEIMAAFTIWFLCVGVASPGVGRVVDRHGAQKIVALGAITAGIGFALLSLMNNLWHFYFSYVVIGAGMAAISHVPASAVVSNWFKKRRGMAIGIMSIGLGVGGIALAPLIGGYLIPNLGWRMSYLALALLTWVSIIPLALLVIKTKPAEMGLHPDGEGVAESIVSPDAPLPTPEGIALRAALATPAFWLIAITFLTSQFSHVGTVQSQVPYLEDIGFPVATAATVLGGVGLVSAIGKFGFGWICDLIPVRYALSIGLGLQLAGIIVLMNIGPTSSVLVIWIYAIIMGLGAGSWLPTMSMVVSANFGLATYGAIFGAISLVHAIGSATGPLLAGNMYDSMNNYYWAFTIFAALYLVAIPAILAVRRPKSL